MLGELVSYARRRGLVTEPGFRSREVRWAVVAGAGGRFLGVDELGAAGEKGNRGRTFARCPELSQPEIKRGGPGCRHFLVDSAEVVALLVADPAAEPDAKLRAKHAYFTGLLRQASSACPELAAAADLLADPEGLAAIRRELAARKAKPTDWVTFRLPDADPSFPVESEAWHGWWRAFRAGLGRDEAGGRVRCLASGELVEPVATQPKIIGLADVGGLAMGDVLAAFKQEAFCSYGLEQAANAPVSEELAFAYRAGLNDLLKETGRRLGGGVKVVHWYSGAVRRDDDPLDWLLDGADAEVEERAAQSRARSLLAAIERGERADLAGYRYHVLALSGAGGRVMVREAEEGEFADLVRSIESWFGDLAIVRRDGAGLARAPKLFAVLASLVREPKDLPPAMEVELWRAALHRRPIPHAAMAMALTRFKVDVLAPKAAVPHARLGLLRAFAVRQGDPAMEPILNEDHPDPAYQCGRLLAMLAAVQHRALGDIGAGVVQRYYGAASATPALVLGRLTRTAQFHLDKLDRGLARWHEGRIAAVWGRLHDRVPQTLSLAEQSLFALGYYQQIASDRARTTRPAGQPAPGQETDHAQAD